MKNLLTIATFTFSFLSYSSQATIVEFQTSHGNFKVNLHDETTPKTVENFLNYVNNGSFDNTIIHRTVDDFVVQGGGAKFEGTLPPTWIDVNSTITNEPVYSNVAGTISMAKQSGKIDSATSQWFINTKNNASVLDAIDIYGGGAYAVFGEVIDDGMDVVNAIAAVPRCDTRHSGFRELPMPDYSSAQCFDASVIPSVENFVTVYSVVIFDSTVNSASSLSPVKNTLYKPVTQQPDSNNDKGTGGSWSIFAMLVLCSLTLFKRLTLSK